jgi:hypothetical protein
VAIVGGVAIGFLYAVFLLFVAGQVVVEGFSQWVDFPSSVIGYIWIIASIDLAGLGLGVLLGTVAFQSSRPLVIAATIPPLFPSVASALSAFGSALPLGLRILSAALCLGLAGSLLLGFYAGVGVRAVVRRRSPSRE